MLSGLIIGLLLGFLLQRGQFCFVSGFRNLYTKRDITFLTALLITISIQSVGFFFLADLEQITLPNTQLPLNATILGAFIFGIGMVLSNCCASGGWFRTGEGAMGSLVALVCFSITMAATQTGALKHWISPLLLETVALDNIYLTLQISPWYLVALLLCITFTLVIVHFRQAKTTQETQQAVSFQLLFAKTWHPFLTAVFIGLLGIVAWVFSAETGRNYGFSVAVPSANVIQYIVIGQQRYLNWGSYFVLGILLGSFLTAKLSGSFELRMPDAQEVIRRILGGITMGIGAALAGGCTITNSLVSTAYFSWQGWLATLMFILGSWFATKFIRTRF
ncbi:YeeE/YedE family protein [Ursidibacter sp. B-7004-1]